MEDSKGFNSSVGDWRLTVTGPAAQNTGRISTNQLNNHNAPQKDKQPKKPAWNIGTRMTQPKPVLKKEAKKEEQVMTEEKPASVAQRSRSRLYQGTMSSQIKKREKKPVTKAAPAEDKKKMIKQMATENSMMESGVSNSIIQPQPHLIGKTSTTE